MDFDEHKKKKEEEMQKQDKHAKSVRSFFLFSAHWFFRFPFKQFQMHSFVWFIIILYQLAYYNIAK